MQSLHAPTIELEGSRLIEASAGTGKTFTITTLYLRLIVERGFSVGEILVVTFTRAAVAELRERIRQRLREAHDVLEESLARPGATVGRGEESVLEALVSSSHERGQPAEDLRRLADALRSFDEAAVFTIHGFGDRVLEENAFESGMAFGTELVREQSVLLEEVVGDFWTRSLYDAPREFVRWLKSSASRNPASLAELVGKLRSQATLEVLPERAPVPTPGLDVAWRRAFESAETQWRSQGEEVLRLLADAARREVLNKSSYNLAKIESQWCSQIDAFFRSALPGEADAAPFANLAAARVKLRTRKNQQPPTHPFFETAQRLVEADAAYAEDLRLRWVGLKLELLEYARREWRRRQREARTRSFDDLMTDLDAALAGPRGELLAEKIRARFPAALVDEFQDTDPTQYRIFGAIWGSPPSVFFMIGDPKQAIYGFRGADVFAYMNAKRGPLAGEYTLDRNWRSDPRLVQAVNAVFRRVGSPFLFDAIPFFDAEAPARSKQRMDPAAAGGAPLRLLWMDFNEEGKARSKEIVGREIPPAIAADIARLLASDARIDERPITAGDVAVLCRTNPQAQKIRGALLAQGIPCVMRSDESVFDTPDAEDLHSLLAAAADPLNSRLLRAALATPLIGLDAGDLASLREDADAWELWLLAAREWQRCLQRGGAIALLEKIFRDHATPLRWLNRTGGERRLTNLLHLGELLQKACQNHGMGSAGQAAWLKRMRSDPEARRGEVAEDALMRLESDARAVQIVTVHRSKGLQYPIVYCPYPWDEKTKGPKNAEWILFHDPEEEYRLKLDLGSAAYARAQECARGELLAESLRLLYVALTRAEERLIVAWGPVRDAGASPLAYLLHPPPDADSVLQQGIGALAERCVKHFGKLDAEALEADLAALVGASGGTIAIEPLDSSPAPRHRPAALESASVGVRSLTRAISQQRRVSSFSGLVAGAERAGAPASAARHSELHPASRGLDHEDPGTDPGDAAAEGSDSDPLIRLHDFPSGAGPGTLIHRVFERIDFAPAASASLQREVREALSVHGHSLEWADSLAEAIRETLATPLGGPLGEFRLAELSRSDRVDEMGFFLPVAEGGVEWTAARLAAVLASRARSPLVIDYAERAGELGFRALEGHLRGFIDLVFRHGGSYYLVDYTSNQLGGHARDYAPAALDRAMFEHDYVLQYHLYTVALHRHLARCLEDYDYDRHLGGSYYLFMRGMAPDSGTGIYYDRPPRELIEALSACIAGGEAGADAPERRESAN